MNVSPLKTTGWPHEDPGIAGGPDQESRLLCRDPPESFGQLQPSSRPPGSHVLSRRCGKNGKVRHYLDRELKRPSGF